MDTAKKVVAAMVTIISINHVLGSPEEGRSTIRYNGHKVTMAMTKITIRFTNVDVINAVPLAAIAPKRIGKLRSNCSSKSKSA